MRMPEEMTPDLVDTAPKQGRGRWKPGESGNPDGRPRGSRNKTTLAAIALLDGEAEALTRTAIEKALEGDMAALRLCLERIVPPARSRAVEIDLPPFETTQDIVAATGAVVNAVADGAITVDEAQGLADVLERHRRAIETVDLERRITALENGSK